MKPVNVLAIALVLAPLAQSLGAPVHRRALSMLAPETAPAGKAAPTSAIEPASELLMTSVFAPEPSLTPSNVPFASIPSSAIITPSPNSAPPPPSWTSATTNLTSFVEPGRAYAPPLTAEQEANLETVKSWNQGTSTVSASRNFTAIGAQNLNCGTGYMNSYFQGHFVGISNTIYSGGQYCGLCLNVTCVDTVCPRAMLDYALFMIVDSCEECGTYDFTVAAPGVGNLTDVNYNINPSLRMAWVPVMCDSMISGGIRMLPSNQNNAFFIGINLSNVKGHVAAVQLSGRTMEYQSYGYWTINTPGVAIELPQPLVLSLTSNSGQTLTVTLPSIVALDLGINFNATST